MSEVLTAMKALIVKENKFLVVKIHVGDQIFWDLPGGRVKFGENPYDTLHREVLEETSLEVEIVKSLGAWWFFRSAGDGKQVVCHTFLCKPKHMLTKPGSFEDEVISEVRWVTKEEFLELRVNHESLYQLIQKEF